MENFSMVRCVIVRQSKSVVALVVEILCLINSANWRVGLKSEVLRFNNTWLAQKWSVLISTAILLLQGTFSNLTCPTEIPFERFFRTQVHTISF